MRTNLEKDILQSGIEYIDIYIDDSSVIDAGDLHNKIYNEDYFIIGHWQAEQSMQEYGIFNIIDEVIQYEKDNFGEVNTEINAESILNMFAYIKGEEYLSNCDSFGSLDGNITKKQFIQLSKELNEQL